MLIDEETMRNFLEAVKHGSPFWFREARLLAEALGEIPNNFWHECDYQLFKCQKPTKKELLQMREEIISAVVQVITEASQKDCTAINDLFRYLYMLCRHYPESNNEEYGAILVKKAKKVNLQDYFETDHYARYFHILAILGVPKNSTMLPENTSWNYSYNFAYNLWKIDDGTKESLAFVEKIAWYSAELRKGPWRENLPYRHS